MRRAIGGIATTSTTSGEGAGAGPNVPKLKEAIKKEAVS
jgi:hypothetical protein